MDLFRKSAGYRYLDAFVLANVIDLATRHFCMKFLISRTLNMMDRYIKGLGQEFVESGGFRERLSSVRSDARSRQESDSAADAPACPKCGAPMRRRRTRKDGRPFWGCSEYPACQGILDIRADSSPQEGRGEDGKG